MTAAELTPRQREVLCALYEAGALPGRHREPVFALADNDYARIYKLPDVHYGGPLMGLRGRGLVSGERELRLGDYSVYVWQLTTVGVSLAQDLVGAVDG